MEWKKHNGHVIDSVKDYDVIDCEVCGFKHIIPIPSEEQLTEIYKEEYYSLNKPTYIEKSKEDFEWWDVTYKERYDKLETLLKSNTQKLLDIGSGPGYFLLHGKNRGWEVEGIEPSRQAAKHSRSMGLTIVNDFFNKEISENLGCYDVVYLSEVLEHVPNPIEIIQLAKKLLNPNGLLCVVAPNDYNPFHTILREHCGYSPWWVSPPHHINYFNFDSIEKLLCNEGLTIEIKESTFPIDMFLLMGDNYIGNDELGSVCHSKRKAFEMNLSKWDVPLKDAFYTAMAKLGIGREFVVYARSVL